MNVHIEEQIAKLHACTVTSTILPWSLIGIMFQIGHLGRSQIIVNTYLVPLPLAPIVELCQGLNGKSFGVR